MKKIGVLFGREDSFPSALIARINGKGENDFFAEAIHIDKLVQAAPTTYSVIIDRVSQAVPFYRAYLKNAALGGAFVINNPFWSSADEKFFNSSLGEKIGISMPKTVLFPSHYRPEGTIERTFRNLAFPLDYEAIFEYVGFPAFFKPLTGGDWKHVFKIYNQEEFFKVYAETGHMVMMLQESIEYDAYFRGYCIDRKHVRIMSYEPKNPFQERYRQNPDNLGKKLRKEMEKAVLKLNQYLGYDLNSVEVAVRDNVLYPIDFCNPIPDADLFSLGDENFEWVVEQTANMAIDKAKKQQEGQVNLTWGKFLEKSIREEALFTNKKS